MLELNQIESFYPQSLRPFKKNLLREYLQYKMLEIIFSSPFVDKLSFMGGTAVHIIYELPRFSEDLDFDNRGLGKEDFNRLTEIIQKKLKLQGYNAEVRNSFRGAYRSYIKVAGILYENKLSAHLDEKMLIQIDAEPQGFSYNPEKVMLNKFDVFMRINSVPLDILLAQKIFAIFMRKRPMGRDFYDVIFLLGRARPNFDYLRSKLKIEDAACLKKRLIQRCEKIDFKHLAKDVEQFLFTPSDAKKVLLFPDYIESIDTK